MGLLDNLRESYQTKLNQRRIERDLPPLKFGDRKLTAWEKEKAKRINLPLVLDTEDKVKVYRLNKEGRNKVKRYQHVFKNSPKIMKMIKELDLNSVNDASKGTFDIFLKKKL